MVSGATRNRWQQSPEFFEAAGSSIGSQIPSAYWFYHRPGGGGNRLHPHQEHSAWVQDARSRCQQGGAQFAGINVNRTMLIAALVSGGIAGLAGVGEIAGIHYHLINELSNGYGYTGIIVATLGGLNPIGVTIAALFIGLIGTGSQNVSRVLGVPVYLGDVVQSTLLLVTLAMLLLQNYRIKRI